jgi:NADH-quinone oxidoreductase subunit E
VSWQTIDRNQPAAEMGPGLSEATKEKIRQFFPRYPTKRAVLLPALHIAQDALGYVSLRAMRDIADLLEVPPSHVMDVVSFYTQFWTHPRGKKTIVLCRSLTCELLGGRELLDGAGSQAGHQGSRDDARRRMVAHDRGVSCGLRPRPCMQINEKMHKCVKVDDLDRILNDPENDKLTMPRSDLFDAPKGD